MNQKHKPSDTLNEIRSMMERSSRFISLSGLSGIAAGVFALIGITLVYMYLDLLPFESRLVYYEEALNRNKWGLNYAQFAILNALFIIISAAASASYFTMHRARQKGQKVGIGDALTRRLLINLLIPLATGGIFCLALYYHGYIDLVAPGTLIFYGLALLNASKFTLDDVRYLAYSELILGLIALFLLRYGLEFWALGFGLLHIFYGVLMYRKYD